METGRTKLSKFSVFSIILFKPLIFCCLHRYTLILMDLLYQTLKETHFFSKKLIVLTRSSGQLLLSLATVVVSLLPKYKSGDKQVCVKFV